MILADCTYQHVLYKCSPPQVLVILADCTYQHVLFKCSPPQV
jgi:hypothetical protein